MKNIWTKEKTMLEEQIDDLHGKLSKEEVDSEEYRALMSTLERCYKIKSEQNSDRVDANTKAAILGNLAGIALILNYERVHVISTKALGFIVKSKV